MRNCKMVDSAPNCFVPCDPRGLNDRIACNGRAGLISLRRLQVFRVERNTGVMAAGQIAVLADGVYQVEIHGVGATTLRAG